MNFCPMYKNPKVFKGFNEIIKALGGREMTLEEFRDSTLRNQRTGNDFYAMEATYRLWDMNGGNPLDYTKDGKPSVLFEQLYELCGDRQKAIIAKSSVYSNNFFNWFGDWVNDPQNSSKVVDSNGEPMIVFHHTDDENLSEFRTDFDNYFSLFKNGTKSAIFFTTNSNKILGRQFTIPVFLNLRTPFTYHGTKESMHEIGTTYTKLVNAAEEVGGAIFTGLNDNKLENQTVLIAYQSNNIKSATKNNGNYSKKPNIYRMYNENVRSMIENEMKPIDMVSELGSELSSKLLNGEYVSSRELINSLGITEMHSSDLFELCNMLLRHNIPVVLSNIEDIAYNYYDTELNQSVIVINENLFKNCSKSYVAEVILHELVHSVTTKALYNSETSEEKSFANSANTIFNKLQGYNKLLNNVQLSGITKYALTDVNEFCSVFATNSVARSELFDLANKLDNKSILNNIKKFINSMVKLFINKNLFNDTNVEQLNLFQNNFKNYLYNQNTIDNTKDINQLFASLYTQSKAKDFQTIFEYSKDIKNGEKFIKNNFHIDINLTRYSHDQKQTKYFEQISEYLEIRAKSLRANNNLSLSEKEDLLTQTITQMNMFSDEKTPNFIAITAYLSQASLQLIEDNKNLDATKRKLFNEDEDIIYASDTDYMDLMHSNYAMHQAIAKILSATLENSADVEAMVKEYNDTRQETDKITVDDVLNLKESIKTINEIAAKGKEMLEIIRKQTSINSLRKIGIETNNQNLLELVFSLENSITFDSMDVNWFDANLGAADASSSEFVRALAYKIALADEKAVNRTRKFADSLLHLQHLCEKEGSNIDDIFEKDSLGYATGLMVRDLNFGQYYIDHDNFLQSDEVKLVKDEEGNVIYVESGLNKYISEKYKINLSKNNRIAPQNEEAAVEWNKMHNRWKSKHCERKYTEDYYELWSDVPPYVMEVMQRLNNQISSILSKPRVKDENGYYHYENLNEEDWNLLNELWSERKELRSDFDKFGHRKEEGTYEYKIAKILQNLDKKLYGDEDTRVYGKLAWENARNSIIEECGGQEEYQKFLNGESNTFNFDKLDAWDARNSKHILKKLEGHKQPIVFEIIKEAMRGYEVNYGEEYDALTEEMNKLLSVARDQSGEVNPDLITEYAKNRLLEIKKRRYTIRKNVKNSVPAIRQLAAKYKELFDMYLKTEDTRYMRQIKKRAWKFAYSTESEDEEINDDEAYLDYLSYMVDYEDQFWNDEDELDVEEVPYTWLTNLVAKDRQYMDTVPGKGWVEQTNVSQKFNNPNFDESYEQSEVPKRSKYDNSKQFAKVNSEGTAINKMYNKVLETIKDANSMQTNRTYTNNYMLPLKNGGLWRMLNPSFSAIENLSDWVTSFTGKMSTIFDWILQKVGISRLKDVDEKNTWETNMYGQFDEAGNPINSQARVSVLGTYADGTPFNALRQYYTARLAQPSSISRDLVNILTAYHLMSSKYYEKSLIKNECETIVDYIKSLKFLRDEPKLQKDGKILKKTAGGEDNTKTSRQYEQARSLMDRCFYGYSKQEINIPIPGFGTINIHCTLDLLKSYTTALNLGMNKSVAAVGLLSANFIHLMNAITCQKYGKRQLFMAMIDVAKYIGHGLLSGLIVGNNRSDNKLQLAMELMNVASQLDKKWQNTRHNSIARTVFGNWMFGNMSTADYLSKANIMIATLREYRLVDGKFMTRDDIRMDTKANGQHRTDYLLKEWGNAKSLWNYMTVKKDSEGISQIGFESQEAKKAFKEKYSIIRNRCEKYAENADGMATALQKAGVQRTWIGAFVFIHRQYLPLMLQERWGQTVWDNDTQQYKNGINRSLIYFINELCCSNMFASTAAGATLSYLTLSTFFGPITASLVGAGVGAWYNKHNKNKGKSKSLKEAINKSIDTNFLFGRKNNIDDISEKEYRQRLVRSYNIKRIFNEVILYNLILHNLVLFVNHLADKDKKNWWLLTLAYWLTKFDWEAYTPYRYDDILNSIKSATAASSVTDALGGLADTGITSMASLLRLEGLFEFLGLLDGSVDLKVKNGVYEGKTKAEKKFIKALPFKNEYEQGTPFIHEDATGPKLKNNYIRHQLFKE